MAYDRVKWRISSVDRASNESFIDDYAQHLDSAKDKESKSGALMIVGYIPSRRPDVAPNIRATLKHDSATFEGSPLKWYLGAEEATRAGLQEVREAMQALADALGEELEVLERAKVQGVELCRDIELMACKASEALERISGLDGYEKRAEYNGTKYYQRLGSRQRASRDVKLYDKGQELRENQGIATDRELLRIEIALRELPKSPLKVRLLGDLLTPEAWGRAESIINDLVKSIMVKQLEGLSPEQVASAMCGKQEKDIAEYATILAIGGISQYLQALRDKYHNGTIAEPTYKRRRAQARKVWKRYEGEREQDTLERELKAPI